MGLNGEDFPGYFTRNLVLYLVWIVLWGVPAVAGFAELTRHDGPPLLAGLWMLVFGFMVVGIVVFPQVFVQLAYLAIVFWSPRRRLVAIVLSPLAAGIMLAFAETVLQAAVVLLAAATYGASLWFQGGPSAWWQRRPLIVWAAAAWLVLLAAVGFVQPLSAGIRTDVTVTIRDADRTGRYRLRCEYDRAGRVRRAVRGRNAHPGGVRACEVLDDLVRIDGPTGESLQEGCLPDQRTGEFMGKVRGRRFRERVVAAQCVAESFEPGEANLLVPPVPD